jgi:class 3 adenylate cyclase
MTKRNIRLILFIWDAVAIALIFFSLIMMFEIVIKNLLIDANIHTFTEVAETSQGEYKNAMNFLDSKPGLPYADSIKAITSYLKDFSLNNLTHDRSLAMVVSHDRAFPTAIGARNTPAETYQSDDIDFASFYFAAARIPASLTREEYGTIEKKLNEADRKYLAFYYKADDPAKNPVLAGYPGQSDALHLRHLLSGLGKTSPTHVEFTLKGRAYVGVAGFLSVPIGSGLNKASLETFNPVIVIADAADDFFALINNIRNLFLIILGAVIGIVFFIKVYNTYIITREIKDISGTIREESLAIERKGEIGTALKELPLKFRETGTLYDSYSQLSVKLADVGEIIAGIADRELFVATLKNDKSLLDPHEVEMAILFLDVQGFTAVSEKHKEKAMSLINRIWSAVEAATGKQQGKINKYMGDAALIIFPETSRDKQEPASRRAVRAAIEILESVPALKKELAIEFNFRIGIDFGKLVYGKTGSDRNFELGVIGDPVNTASRCEGLNKKYGTNILLTGEALRNAGFKTEKAQALSDDPAREFSFILLDKARPAGKKEAKQIYSLLVKTKSSGQIRLAGTDAAYDEPALDSYTHALQDLVEGIGAWQESDKKAAAKKWGALATESRFPPARNFLSKLLSGDELARFSADPVAWLKATDIKIKAPDADWIAYGAVELPK